MKNTSIIIIFLLVSLVSTSCLKKVTDSILPDGTSTIVFDGKTTKITNPKAVSALGIVTIISGDTKTGFTVILNKTDIKTGKKYDLKNPIGVFTFFYDGTTYVPSSGTLEITNFKDNSIVEGKFDFEGSPIAKSAKSAFSGTFEVKILL